jgi:nucleotide-binding universal stress UspA family protein
MNSSIDTGCGLVVMSTHGHHFVADLFFGTTARRVRYSVNLPALLLRTK